MASKTVDLAHGIVTVATILVYRNYFHRRERTRSGQQQHGTRDPEQCRGHVAPPAAAARCLADDRQVAVAQCRLASSAQQPEVQRRQQGQRQHQPQRIGPQEVHGLQQRKGKR
jgi:hypothetical protein